MPYRPNEKTVARKAEIRQRLLERALATVAEVGFSGLTISQLAQDVGIATGAVYRHFDSKAQLCAELFRIAAAKEVAVVRENAERAGAPVQRLLDAIAAFAFRAIRARRLAYALIAEPVDAAVDQERLRYRRQYAQMFERLIEDGMRSGDFPPQAVGVSAAALVGVISEALIGPLAGAQTLQEEELVRAIQAFCLRAITGRELPVD